MQNDYFNRIKRSIIYKGNQLDNKDIDKTKQKDMLDQLINNISAKRQMLIQLQENNESEDEHIEALNLTTVNNEEKEESVKEPSYKSVEIDQDFLDDINKEEKPLMDSKIIKTSTEANQPETKKKFFDLYKANDDSKEEDNLAADFESEYNSNNLNINLNPSKNQFVRIYDDMMNDEVNNSPERLSELTTKIFDFMRMNPISVDIGDMIIRLGMKYLNLTPKDNLGALRCFEDALKIYTQINDNLSRGISSDKNSISPKKNFVQQNNNMDLKSIYLNNSVMMNQTGANVGNTSTANMNSLSQYKSKAVKIRLGETLKKISDCYITEDDTINALIIIESAIKHYTSLFGEKSIEVAYCIFKKAYILQLQSKWKEATEIYNIALIIYQNIFKSFNIHYTKISHKEIADCYFKLGLIKEKQKNFNLSIEYYNMAVEIYKNHFKNELNDECALAMFNLGLLHEVQDHKEKAYKFYLQVRDIYAKIKKENQEYIDILIKTSNMSILFNKYQEASEDLFNALEATIKKNNCESFEGLLEKIFSQSDEDPITLYFSYADLVEIAFLLTKVYTVPEHNKFQEGFETLKIVLALMPSQKDFIDETHTLLKKLLENLNEDNYKTEWEDDIVDCITQFIVKLDIHVEEKKILFANDDYEAEMSEQKVNKTENSEKSIKNSQQQEVYLQSESDEVSIAAVPKISYKNGFFFKTADMTQILGKNCSRIKIHRAAVELYLKSVMYLENIDDDGASKLKVCEFLNMIGLEYSNLSNMESAKTFFEKALELRIKLHGQNDLRTAAAYNNLAIAYNKMGEYYNALECWQSGIALKKNIISDEEDPRLAKDYYNFAIILYKMKEYDNALVYMLDALYIFDKKIGKNSHFSADACLFIGETYKLINNLTTAVQFSSRAMAYYSENLKEDHPNRIKSRLLFGICLSFTSKYDKAIMVFKPVIEGFMNNESICMTSLFIESVYEYAKCLDWLNKYEESLKYFEIFIDCAGEEWSDEKLKKVSNKIAQLVNLIILIILATINEWKEEKS